MTRSQKALLSVIRSGADIHPVKCPSIRALVARGFITIEPTAFGFGRCRIIAA